MGKKTQQKKENQRRKQNLRQEVQAVYDHLPRINCKGLCHASCGPIPVFAAEVDSMAAATAFPVRSQLATLPEPKDSFVLLPRFEDEDDNPNANCPLLRHNRCTIYEQRPFICRIYGTSEGIRCPHGCEPEWVLSREEAATLIDEMDELSSLVKIKGI